MVADTVVYGAYGGHIPSGPTGRTRYAGHVAEAPTGWHLLGRRIYNPTLRRFLNPDALSPFDKGGLNRHAYCNGDPMGRIDPEGQSWVAWFITTLERIDLVSKIGTTEGKVPYDFYMPKVSSVATGSPELTQLRNKQDLNALFNDGRSVIESHIQRLIPVGRAASRANVAVNARAQMVVTWPHTGNINASTIFTASKRTITAVSGKDPFFDDPRRSKELALGEFWPTWQAFLNRNDGIHFATTSNVTPTLLHPLMAKLAHTFGREPVTILAGAHGRPDGMNWLPDGSRNAAETKFFDRVGSKAAGLPWNATIKKYEDIDSRSFRRMLRSQGIFLHVTCYGAADEEFMRAFNLEHIELRMRK